MDPDKRKVYHPVEIPHWLNLCNLDGFPGASMVCPHDAQRIRQLYTDGAYDVSELSNGMRVLSVNGEVFSSYNTHTGRLGDEYARATVEMASTWRRVTAGGERPVRALLLGLGGGAMVSGLHHKCHARSSFRHRRASTGVQGCVITAVEIDPNMVRIARQLFLGVDGAGADMGAGIADGMANENAVKFVVADATNYVLHDAQEGGFDVVINDVYDQQGVMPPRLRDARFYGDVRRLLGAGGLYIVNAIAPAWGPGTGRGDLSVVRMWDVVYGLGSRV
jgi:SAM-dependent methyltransferase